MKMRYTFVLTFATTLLLGLTFAARAETVGGPMKRPPEFLNPARVEMLPWEKCSATKVTAISTYAGRIVSDMRVQCETMAFTDTLLHGFLFGMNFEVWNSVKQGQDLLCQEGDPIAKLACKRVPTTAEAAAKQ